MIMNNIKDRVLYAVTKRAEKEAFKEISFVLPANECKDIVPLYQQLKPTKAERREAKRKGVKELFPVLADNGFVITLKPNYVEATQTAKVLVRVADEKALVFKGVGIDVDIQSLTPHQRLTKDIPSVPKENIHLYAINSSDSPYCGSRPTFIYCCERTGELSFFLETLEYNSSDTILAYIIEGNQTAVHKIMNKGKLTSKCLPFQKEIILARVPSSRKVGMVDYPSTLRSLSIRNELKNAVSTIQEMLNNNRSNIIINIAKQYIPEGSPNAQIRDDLCKGAIFTETLDNLIELIHKEELSRHEQYLSGPAFAAFVDEQLFSNSIEIYEEDMSLEKEKGENLCNAYGGPLIDFFVNGTTSELNDIVLQNISDILIKEGCPYALKLSCVNWLSPQETN